MPLFYTCIKYTLYTVYNLHFHAFIIVVNPLFIYFFHFYKCEMLYAQSIMKCDIEITKIT